MADLLYSFILLVVALLAIFDVRIELLERLRKKWCALWGIDVQIKDSKRLRVGTRIIGFIMLILASFLLLGNLIRLFTSQ